MKSGRDIKIENIKTKIDIKERKNSKQKKVKKERYQNKGIK